MKISISSLAFLSMALGIGAAIMPRQNPQYNVVFAPASFQLGIVSTINYTATLLGNNNDQQNLDLLLLQTTAGAGAAVNQSNTAVLLTAMPDICIYGAQSGNKCSGRTNLVPAGVPMTTQVGLNKGTSFNAADSLNNLFFCMATSSRDNANPASVCNYYSNIFDLVEGVQVMGQQRPIIPTGASITVNNTAPSIIQLMEEQVSVTLPPASTVTPLFTTAISSMATVTASLTSVSESPAQTSVSSVNSSVATHSNGGLSVGAKVGIALGALVVFALLLLGILFCLRRKHSKRSAHRALSPHQPPEQVMLTRSMHTDSFGNSASNSNSGGRNGILAEKEDALASAAALNHVDNSASSSPIHEPETRHSAVAPYVPLPSLPYSGTAMTIPRRKPTNATIASTVSRNISSASAMSSGPMSPRSQTTPRSDDFSPYHDVPIYGDARHSPQVFSGGDRNIGGASSPFVTEEMSAEEVARLEEEERRIDAAIAEAERR